MLFSQWLRSIPNAYGTLKPEWVQAIREQVIADKTYDQLTTWTQVKRLTNSHRVWLFWDNDQRWQQLLITVECLWNAYQEAKKVKPPKPKAQQRQARTPANPFVIRNGEHYFLDLQCFLRRHEYDYSRRALTLWLHEPECVDMEGAIKFAKRIDPGVLKIASRYDGRFDTIYKRESVKHEWAAQVSEFG